MFGVLTTILFLAKSANASPAQAGESVGLSNAQTEPAAIPSCVIPVYVNIGSATPSQVPTYLGAVYNAILRWNAASAGVFFKLEDMIYPTDRKDGAVTITMTALPEERASSEIGVTFNMGRPGVGITRARILLNSKDPWCITGGNQYGCYQMENVLVHEIGHAIGLPHNDDPETIMFYGIRQEPIKQISQNDVDKAKSLFPRGSMNCSTTGGTLVWSLD